MSPSVTFSVAQQIGANPYFYQKKKKTEEATQLLTCLIPPFNYGTCRQKLPFISIAFKLDMYDVTMVVRVIS